MGRDLKSAGLRVTLPRKQILRVFENAKDRHLSAEDVYKTLSEAGDEIGLATVYRVLKQYEESGLLVKRSFEGNRAVYELNDDHSHDHLVCVICNRVDEFSDDTVQDRLSDIAKQHQYRRSDHTLTIYGVCQGCTGKG